MKFSRIFWVMAVFGMTSLSGLLVQPRTALADWRRCWNDPAAASLKEMASIVPRENSGKQIKNAALLLSNGDIRDLKTGYAAGLLVGWERTGRRPDFRSVTAVGVSTLIAPFAFIGRSGDKMIAEIYNCNASTPSQMAAKAAGYIDEQIVAQIESKHAAGAQLLVALPGSPGRREVVWDLGAIAASGHPDRVVYIRNILKASVDHLTYINPEKFPVPAGRHVSRNMNFRKTGSGQAFVMPQGQKTAVYYIVENTVRIKAHSQEYAANMQDRNSDVKNNPGLVTAYDLAMHVRSARIPVFYASISRDLNLLREKPFEMNYVRSLFQYAFRQGRMGLEWRKKIPAF